MTILISKQDVYPLTIYSTHIKAHEDALRILLSQQCHLLQLPQQPKFDLELPLPSLLTARKEGSATVQFGDSSMTCCRSAFVADQHPLGIPATDTQQASAQSNFLLPVVIALDSTIFFHTWQPDHFEKFVQEYGYQGDPTGRFVSFQCPVSLLQSVTGTEWSGEAL